MTKLGAAHEAVRRALINSDEPDLIRAASSYATLGEYRRKADYDLDNEEVEDAERAEEMVKRCESANSRIGMVRLRMSQDRTARDRMVEAINKWLSNDGESHIWM